MKISTKGRYSVRLMYDLAIHNTGEYITIKSIAKRQEISVKYLEQIISILNKAGFVKSIRGAQGGYKLAREPKDITIGMILRLTEGSLSTVLCLDDEQNQCKRALECPTLFIWQKINDTVNNIVDNITLEDIINRDKQLNGNNYMI